MTFSLKVYFYFFFRRFLFGGKRKGDVEKVKNRNKEKKRHKLNLYKDSTCLARTLAPEPLVISFHFMKAFPHYVFLIFFFFSLKIKVYNDRTFEYLGILI